MTKIIGIDFGTVNVRISQRDATSEDGPSICQIGSPASPNPKWMPAVIAFRMNPGETKVETLVGEEADVLDDSDDIVVVRNIKKYATSSDAVVRAVMQWDYDRGMGKSWPTWINLEDRSIRVWNETMSSEEAMKLILKEAITRAGLAGEAAEWRAGCPVSSDLTYREALIAALDELGCEGKVEWIAEEPLLFLALGKALGTISETPSLYMVYDLGGGSFDCSVVGVDGDSWAVYGQDGLPEGGMDIDEELRKKLDYKGPMHELRDAKERLSSETPEIRLSDGSVLTTKIANDVEGGFFDQTLMAMLTAYSRAKMIWAHPDEIPEYGGHVDIGGGVEGVKNMVADIDKALVVGGPTGSPYILRRLKEIFEDKMMTAGDIAQSAGRTDMTAGEIRITALAYGAGYMPDNSYSYATVDRTPATITLKVANEGESKQDTYEAFRRTVYQYRNPTLAASYRGDWISLESEGQSAYQVLVTNADGKEIYDSGQVTMRMPRDGYLGPRANRIRLVIEGTGAICVQLGAGFENVANPDMYKRTVWKNPPWQTGVQVRVMEELEKRQRQREEEERRRRLANLDPLPYNDPS